MQENLNNHRDSILKYFEKSEGDYWKTVDEISAQTKIDAATVIKVISTSGDFVRSSYRRKAGEPLFTSRKMFRNKAPFVDKVIGAFKNRID